MLHNDCCDSDTISNKCNSITIVQGSDRTFGVDLYDDDGAFDLTGVTEIVVAFPGITTPVHESLTSGKVSVLGAPGGGKILVTASAANTNLMLVNPFSHQFQDLQVTITIASKTTIFILPNVLNIEAQRYS